MKIFKEKVFQGLLAAWVITVIGVFTSITAQAYVTGAADPVNGDGEREYRHVKKSETAGVSDAIAVGDILFFDTINNNDGYTVTRVGANTVASASRIACIATKVIATGNTGLNRCLSKGYFPNTSFTTSSQIVIGQKVCGNAAGQAVPCAACASDLSPGNDCRLGSATANSPVTAFSVVLGTGTTLDTYINAR